MHFMWPLHISLLQFRGTGGAMYPVAVLIGTTATAAVATVTARVTAGENGAKAVMARVTAAGDVTWRLKLRWSTSA